MNSDTGGQSSSDLQRQAAAQLARKKVLAAYADAAKKAANDQRSAANQAAAQSRTAENAGNLGTTAASAAIYAANRSTTSSYAATNQAHLKDEPLNPATDPDYWQKYHSAWQNYYQKYYSDYYSNAARDYIAKEQLRVAREQAEEEDIIYALTHASGKSEQKSGLKLSSIAEATSATPNANQNPTPSAAVAGSSQPQAPAQDTIKPLTRQDIIRAKLRRRVRKKATDSAKKTRRFRKFIPLAAGLAVVLTILFLQYNRLIFAPIMAYVSPGNAPASEIEALDPTITQTVSADPRLIIPKLNIDVPIRFGVALDDVMSAMNNGVAHYRIAGASAYPGEVGNFIITGHSAGDVYSSNPYKYIFSGLERLEDGDLIYVNYNSTRYTYQVFKKEVIEPSNVAALVVQTNKPLITLVTCTPLGTSRYRLLVTGEQISPTYDTAQNTDSSESNIDQPTSVTGDSTELPSNEPSFFEGIWNWLTGQ